MARTLVGTNELERVEVAEGVSLGGRVCIYLADDGKYETVLEADARMSTRADAEIVAAILADRFGAGSAEITFTD
jgi:hypothetical protein